MQQPDTEDTNITSSVGARGVIKHAIVLTMIFWLSVSETHSALLFNPAPVLRASFSNTRVSCVYLSLAVSSDQFLIDGWCN